MTALQDALSQYVAVRRALGTQLAEPANTLRQFVAFLEGEGASRITTVLALRWATARPNVQRATWGRRLSMVRKFAAWLHAIDPDTEVPPPRLLSARHRRPRPHIYTEAETRNLMAAAARCRSRTGLRPLTYTTLIGLLAATGLRPGEALALDRTDVDLDGDALHPRDEVRQVALRPDRHHDTRGLGGLCRQTRGPLPVSSDPSVPPVRIRTAPQGLHGSQHVRPAVSRGRPSARERTRPAPVAGHGCRIFGIRL